eukprot:TRINITY_DN2793_c0_g1_i7.p1 TRINITY_DN2793_c0_g1~~TRINITY_DN2793_c0_g1_i7.p1  ORF type:complete len:286 (-),score=38.66 TRINITY_DN2793_c0_g1_i7:196-1053(-)
MVDISQEELDDLSLACQRLWQLDENRLVHSKDYLLNIGEGKYFYQEGDAAPEKLFQGVKQYIWQKQSFLIFYHLLDNYERQTGRTEVVTRREMQEMQDFLNAILETPVMKYTHRYLCLKGLASEDVEQFRNELYRVWFKLYRRDANYDSCGFEHVFVGEEDDGKIKGLHNWIQMYVEESKGKLDYMGFIKPRRRRGRDGEWSEDPDPSEHLLTVQFGWNGEIKDVSSVFIGTSPEFEIALYTLCFLAGEEENMVELDGHRVNIKAFGIPSRHGRMVASVFPKILD